jgi:hypothetical protein
MANLDMLLLRGPSLADTEEGLNELRYTILTKGIPANSEGMVSTQSIPSSCCTTRRQHARIIRSPAA